MNCSQFYGLLKYDDIAKYLFLISWFKMQFKITQKMR